MTTKNTKKGIDFSAASSSSFGETDNGSDGKDVSINKGLKSSLKLNDSLNNCIWDLCITYLVAINQ